MAQHVNAICSDAAGGWTGDLTIVRAVQIGIVDAWSGGGNVITGNTIMQSPYGIWTYFTVAVDDVINPNTFYSVTTLNASGPPVP